MVLRHQLVADGEVPEFLLNDGLGQHVKAAIWEGVEALVGSRHHLKCLHKINFLPIALPALLAHSEHELDILYAFNYYFHPEFQVRWLGGKCRTLGVFVGGDLHLECLPKLIPAVLAKLRRCSDLRRLLDLHSLVHGRPVKEMLGCSADF